MSARLTRRRFFGTAGAALAAASIPGCGLLGGGPGEQKARPPSGGGEVGASSSQAGGETWSFRSRPDLSPPAVSVSTRAREVAPGHVFVAPKKGGGQYGPMIVDNAGSPVWFSPLPEKDWYAMDFKVQSYRGEPVITWWEGLVARGHGDGEYVVLDGSYREVARVPASGRYHRDLHEFNITPRDTAVFTVYDPLRMDLSDFGGAKDGVVFDGIMQEVDLETGEVIFEWHSLDHIGFEESYRRPSPSGAYHDYFHINSIEVEPDGNLLVSARLTSAVYKIDRQSGEVMWRLGGKKSDFEMGEGTRTVFQHDARRQPDGTITIFDNGGVKTYDQSRAITLELDEEAMTSTLLREYTHPDGIFAATQGNMQSLPNGNVFAGWGSEPDFSEFSGDGELLFSASLPPESESYRAFRFEWSGRPGDVPAVAAEAPGEGEVAVYASWNGATEVADWEVLAGPSPERMKSVGSAPRGGFETRIAVKTREAFVAARARDASGRELGVSRAVRPV